MAYKSFSQFILASGDSETNYSYFMPVAAYSLCMLPHYAAMLLAGFKVYDNSKPRNFLNNVATDETILESRKNLILRMEGASLNGFETLGFFCAAVACANQVGMQNATLNGLSLGYVVARVVYILVYISTASMKTSWLRNAAWNVAIWINIGLWIKTGVIAASIH